MEELATHVGYVLKDKLRLDELLGAGGMASVYGATHRNGRRYAVKILHPHYSADPTVRARFLREGRLANTVEHPNVVGVYDDDFDEKCGAFLVMDLLDGESLDIVLESSGKLPQPEAIRVVLDLLDVLEAAHAKGVIHRDLKPANLFMTRRKEVRVLDFGIARLLEDSPGVGLETANGEVMGTPSFMAPEQARGHRDLVDRRADIYSAGAILQSLLTGTEPREGETVQAILFLAMTTPMRSIAEIDDSLPSWLVDIVDRALAFDLEDRWPDARSMADALRDGAKRKVPSCPPRRAAETVPATSQDEPEAPAPLTEAAATAERRSENPKAPAPDTIAPFAIAPRRPRKALAAGVVAVVAVAALALAAAFGDGAADDNLEEDTLAGASPQGEAHLASGGRAPAVDAAIPSSEPTIERQPEPEPKVEPKAVLPVESPPEATAAKKPTVEKVSKRVIKKPRVKRPRTLKPKKKAKAIGSAEAKKPQSAEKTKPELTPDELLRRGDDANPFDQRF